VSSYSHSSASYVHDAEPDKQTTSGSPSSRLKSQAGRATITELASMIASLYLDACYLSNNPYFEVVGERVLKVAIVPN
jgi:hypothetical protein